mmetsp:Transcript_31252/g.72880  ORF Transcript_31252/g.72880 Transcript_31252/m.72880 type:complete len:427 (-) Transcript_31252:59-1339(-)
MSGQPDEVPTLKTIRPEEVEDQDFEPVDPSAHKQALEIITSVKAGREEALLKYAWKFGELPSDSRTFVLGKQELKQAFDALPAEKQQLLQRTAERIRVFAKAQRESVQPTEIAIAGGRAGQTVSPVQRAGCYAPGGRYPLPSSVLMTACTAKTAGVTEVIVASPKPSPVTLGAAYVAGADHLLAVGGAQAIAAMAHGVGVPACDIIVGPGNKWVTAAKSIVNGVCGIDMLAGPSEVLVIADGTANAEVVASDLLAQAEHDVEARPILVTPEQSVIEAVNAALKQQLAALPTKDVAAPAVRNGFAVLVKDIDAAVAVSNRIAPEHLEIQTSDSQKVADACTSYGGLFIGTHAAEVLGDYGAGPNHVLPTSCTAKYTGGLSVHTFLRLRTWMRIDDPAAAKAQVSDAVALAREEGLEGHARAAEKRLE